MQIHFNMFCVYRHTVKSEARPVYIGKGDTARPHSKKGRPDLWYEIAIKNNWEVTVDIIGWFSTSREALTYEKERIKAERPLCNTHHIRGDEAKERRLSEDKEFRKAKEEIKKKSREELLKIYTEKQQLRVQRIIEKERRVAKVGIFIGALEKTGKDFLLEYFRPANRHAVVPKIEIQKKYIEWCDRHRIIKTLNYRELNRVIMENFDTREIQNGNRRTKCWAGIAYKNSEQESTNENSSDRRKSREHSESREDYPQARQEVQGGVSQ